MNVSITPKILTFLVVFGICLFSLSGLLQSTHVLKNLEPYPDGLLYLTQAKQVGQGAGLIIEREGVSIMTTSLPLYPILLAPSVAFSNPHIATVVTNTILLVVTAVVFARLLLRVISRNSKRMLIFATGMTLFLSHASLFWTTSVPMTENAAFLFFCLGLWGVFSPKFDKEAKLFSIFGGLGLLITRFSIVPVGAMMLFISATRFVIAEKKVLRKQLLVKLVVVGTVVLMLFGGRELLMVTGRFLRTLLNPGTDAIFFNFSFVPKQITYYLRLITGLPTNYLWQQASLFPLFGLLFGFANILLWKKGERRIVWASLGLLLALFSILLVFYHSDFRYALYLVPLFSMTTTASLTNLSTKTLKPALLTLSVLALIFLGIQKPLLTQLVANNFLGRSTAWQFQAVKQIDSFAKNELKNIITALPPLYVDLYSSSRATILPLSPNQEYYDKGMYVWGDEIDYQNLLPTYKSWLKEGKELYLSSAYVTHSHLVAEDFEEYKTQFALEPVASGCHDTCTIYKLSLNDQENLE